MQTSDTRILITHAGSLARPPELRRVIANMGGQPTDGDHDYLTHLRCSVADVVQEQVAAGVDVPSDGEFGKLGWTSYVSGRLDGFVERPLRPGETPMKSVRESRDRSTFADFYEAYARIERFDWQPPDVNAAQEVPSPNRASVTECTFPIAYRGHVEIRRDIDNFTAALQGTDVVDAFLPTVAPMSVEGGRTNRFYPTEEEFVFAIADAMRHEYRAVVDAGFLLQVDDAHLPIAYEAMTREDVRRARKFAELRIEALNHALEGIPPDCVRYHVCWGSWNGPHTSDTPLVEIVELILRVNAQAYVLEAANPRHEHEWRVWEDVKLPDGKILVPGVVTHSTNVVEHPELVSWRLQNFARLVGRENVIAGTDCGFSQTWDVLRVHPSIQWAKIRSLAEGAQLATKELWA